MEQLSEEWFLARVGFVTGSEAWKVFSYKKSGEPTQDRINYLNTKACERITGKRQDEGFVSRDMIRGREDEKKCIEEFEEKKGIMIQPCSFIRHPTIDHFGSSPDGLISRNLMKNIMLSNIEVKCPSDKNFLKIFNYEDNYIDEKHLIQCKCHLMVTGGETCIYINYNKNFPSGSRMIIKEIDRKGIEEIEDGIIEFNKEVDDLVKKFHEKNGERLCLQ